jgi:hypothetical protein
MLRHEFQPDRANPWMLALSLNGDGDGGGGDGDGDGGDGDGDAGKGGDGKGRGGEGQQEPDWKEQARKWEARAKKDAEAARQLRTTQAELDKLRKSQMSDQEKAVAEAREAGEKQAVSKVAARLVAAEARAALAGRGLDADRLAELVEDAKDIARLRGDDGEPNVDAVKAWADRIAPAQQQKQSLDLGQGRRGNNAAPRSMNEAIRLGARR